MSFKKLGRLRLKLNCINVLQTPHPLGLNVIPISRIPNFDVFVFSLLDMYTCCKRYHGVRKNGDWKCQNRRVISILNLNIDIKQSEQHMTLSTIITLSVVLLRNYDTEANN